MNQVNNVGDKNNSLGDKIDIEDIVNKEGFFAGPTVGVSMYPMLRNRRDTIVIKPCDGRLKKYDIPLYKRDNLYVLHRVIKVLPDGYVIRGDNCYYKEHITDNQIIGVLSGFYRNHKSGDIRNADVNLNDMQGLLYRLYVIVWRYTYFIRFIYKKFRALIGKILRFAKRNQKKEKRK